MPTAMIAETTVGDPAAFEHHDVTPDI